MSTSPSLIEVQLAPPSVLLKMPTLSTPLGVKVPTYSVDGEVGSIAIVWTRTTGRPLETEVQLAPPSRLLETPWAVPA